jgi:hypothetical protein
MKEAVVAEQCGSSTVACFSPCGLGCKKRLAGASASFNHDACLIFESIDNAELSLRELDGLIFDRASLGPKTLNGLEVTSEEARECRDICRLQIRCRTVLRCPCGCRDA